MLSPSDASLRLFQSRYHNSNNGLRPPRSFHHNLAMATTSGLTRRRGGGAATNNGDDESSRVSSPAPKPRSDDRTPETSYENSANGHKIAFDPRDISESAERS